jgi:hypothetical protein
LGGLLGAGSLLGALTGVDLQVRGLGLELSGWRAGVANLVRGPLLAGAAFAACAPLVYLGLWGSLRLIERFTAALRSDSDSR